MGTREYAAQIDRDKRAIDASPPRSKANTDAFRDGWERAFGKKQPRSNNKKAR